MSNRHSNGPLAAAIVAAALLAGGCATNKAPTPKTASAQSAEFTLGMEVRPVPREMRKKLGLSAGSAAGVVEAVIPGGPAAGAGIRPGEVVREIGTTPATSACELLDAGGDRSAEPVRVVLDGDGGKVEKTIVPVPAAPLLEKSCAAGVESACFRLARVLWIRQRGGDRERAGELDESACRSGFAEACADRGLHRMDSAEGAAAARETLKRGCDLGSGAACAHLAFLYATGKGVGKDDRRATELYVRSCDRGDVQGCYNVGLMADDGRGGPRDFARAAARYDEACAMGSSTACTNLGFLYENGRGVAKDRPRAEALYQRGCDGTRCQRSNLTGCVNVGRAYRDGIGVEKDESRAASIFQEACDRTPDPEDVGADRNRSRACSLLGALYLSGDGIPKDEARARELSELGCERDDAFGCFNAAAIYADGTGVSADAEKAAHYLERACELGDGEGCHDLGVAYEKGNGVAADRRRAAELFRKACSLGFKTACARVPGK